MFRDVVSRRHSEDCGEVARRAPWITPRRPATSHEKCRQIDRRRKLQLKRPGIRHSVSHRRLVLRSFFSPLQVRCGQTQRRGKAVRAVKRKRKKVSSLSVSSAEMHNASLIPGSSNSASTGTESIKEQTSRCGQSVDTSDSESELQDCSFVFAGSSDTVGTEMEPSGRYSSAREPCGTGVD
jgi:hypothetical protein